MHRTDADALLQAILAKPDDDPLRLICADWLEERGDPRGEFIRLQMALADASLNGTRRQELLLREGELRARHEAEWTAPLRALASGWEFRRGLVEEVSLPAQAFIDEGETLFQLAPIRRVRLLAAGSIMPQLGLTPHLQLVDYLDLRGNNIGDVGAEHLAGSPYLDRLRGLDLQMNLIELPGAKALAKAATLGALRSLELGQNSIGPMGAFNVTASPPWKGLYTLGLSFCDVGADGASYLSKSNQLAELSALALSHNGIGDPGARAIGEGRRLPRLQHLLLADNNIGSLGAQAFLGSSHYPHLAYLDLSHNPISPFFRDTLRQRYGNAVRF